MSCALTVLLVGIFVMSLMCFSVVTGLGLPVITVVVMVVVVAFIAMIIMTFFIAVIIMTFFIAVILMVSMSMVVMCVASGHLEDCHVEVLAILGLKLEEVLTGFHVEYLD